ncbi:MAG: gamma-glutamyl-gamma-aminobutyrate hydrolase family protein [Candidatus Woesearchaeota archaeon]
MREIGVVPLCGKDLMLRREFVMPLVRIVNDSGFKAKIVEPNDFSRAEIPCILSGTTLKDFAYLENKKLVEDVRNFKHPLFGICAGAHLIAIAVGGRLTDSIEIGMLPIEMHEPNELFKSIKEGYALHTKGIEVSSNCKALLSNANGTQMFKNKNHLGILFHPEVRHFKIITNWIQTLQ